MTTHGRDCPCTPCRAEDWDAIDAALVRHRATATAKAFRALYPPKQPSFTKCVSEALWRRR